MGEVWRALDERLDREVAIKVLRAEYADDEALRTRLRLEARSAAALSSECVVAVYDWGEQIDEAGRGSSYIVMELVDSDTVAALLARERRLAPDRTAEILADTACGLAAARQHGLVHRDIKPSNLLITGEGRVKVADFGIARAYDALALTATGTLLGTAHYLSPEQVRGQSATPASDIYSLGVVAYQCLTGELPFRGDGDIATATARLNASPPPMPVDVPAPMHELVASMLDDDPLGRPSAAAIAAGPARPTRPMPIPQVPHRRPTTRAATVVGALVLAVVAAVLLVPALLGGTPKAGGTHSAGRSTHPAAASPRTTTSPSAPVATSAVTPPGLAQPVNRHGPGPGPGHRPPGKKPGPPGQLKKHKHGHGTKPPGPAGP